MRVSFPKGVYYGWWVLSAAGLAVFLESGVGGWTFSVIVKAMASEFGASHAQLYGTLTLAGVLGTLIAPFLGSLVDRHGPRTTITGGLIYLGTMLLFTRYVSTVWHFYLVYSVGLGIAQAAIGRVGGSVIAANWFLRWRGVAFAAMMASTSISGAVYPLVAQAIVNQWNWRTVWFVMGLAQLAIGVPVAWLVIRRRPEDMGLYPDGAQTILPPVVGGEIGSHKASIPTADVSWTPREAVKTKTFWLLSASLTLHGFAGMTILTIIYPYFTQQGLAPNTAARLLSFYAFTAFAGTIMGAVLVQAYSLRRVLVPVTLFYTISLAIFIITGTSSLWLMTLVLTALGVSISSSAQMGQQIWADYYGRQHIGSILGMVGMFRMVSLAGPLLAASIHDLLGSYRPAFILFDIFSAVAVVGLIFAKPPRKAHEASNAF